MFTIQRLLHCGFLIESASTRILMDPWLFRHRADTVVLRSPLIGHPRYWREMRLDGIVISHDHLDHFHLPSLALLDRRALIVYPTGQTAVPRFLERLGFKRFRSLSPFEKTAMGDISLMATPSLEFFAEMGMVFEHQRRRFWNTVDTVLDAKTVQQVKNHAGPMDLAAVVFRSFDYSELVNRTSSKKVHPGPWNLSKKLPRWIDARLTLAVDQAWDVPGDDYINERVHAFSATEFVDQVSEKERPCRVWRPGSAWRLEGRKIKEVENRSREKEVWPTHPKTPEGPALTRSKMRKLRLLLENDFRRFLSRYPKLRPDTERYIDLSAGKERLIYRYSQRSLSRAKAIPDKGVSVLQCDAAVLWEISRGAKAIDSLGMGGHARLVGRRVSEASKPDPFLLFLFSRYRDTYFDKLSRSLANSRARLLKSTR